MTCDMVMIKRCLHLKAQDPVVLPRTQLYNELECAAQQNTADKGDSGCDCFYRVDSLAGGKWGQDVVQLVGSGGEKLNERLKTLRNWPSTSRQCCGPVGRTVH